MTYYKKKNGPVNDIGIDFVGYLKKAPEGPFLSKSGETFWSFCVAVNNCNQKDPEKTWWPKMYAFGEVIGAIKDLQKGDKITLVRGVYSPAQVQDPYTDKKGTVHQPVDSVLVFPTRDRDGIYIPLVIKRKPQKEQIVEAAKEIPIAEVLTKKKSTKETITKKATKKITKKKATKKPAKSQQNLPLGKVTEDMVLATIS